jgi:hypothetical protein
MEHAGICSQKWRYDGCAGLPQGGEEPRMFKITSFVTVDSVNFERRTGLPSPERSEEKANTWTNKSDCVAPTDFKILLEEG